MKTKELSYQITATYHTLRLGLAVMALAFPLLLWGGGHMLADLPLAGSMSAYYHAFDPLHPDHGPPGHGVMRNGFVGILFAVGALLFLYQGYSRLEDWALNLAGVFALGMALFPMKWPTDHNDNSFSFHGTFAISFFVCIAYVCIWRAKDTLSLLDYYKTLHYRRHNSQAARRPSVLSAILRGWAMVRDHFATRRRYLYTYQILGWAMVIIPLLTWAIITSLPLHKSAIFFAEVAGIYVFAIYWLIKSNEASTTNLDEKAALGKLRIKPHGLRDAFRPLSVIVDDRKAGQ